MSNKIWYLIGAICALFPIIFIFPLVWWANFILILVVLGIQLFSPLLSTIIQGISWIIGFVLFFIFPYPIWVIIAAVIAFLWWAINQIYFYSLNRINRYPH